MSGISLKSNGVNLPEQKKKASNVITLAVKGRDIRKYNRLDAVEKAAKKKKEAIRPLFLAQALTHLFATNCGETKKPITSLNLQDDSQASAQMSFTARYGKIDPKEVASVFASLKRKDGKPANPNDYINCTVEAAWDSSAFVNSRGKFDAVRAMKFVRAVRRVAKELGVKNPLTFTKVFAAKPNFHEVRWAEFKPEDQVLISTCIPNTVNVSPENDGVSLSFEK